MTELLDMSLSDEDFFNTQEDPRNIDLTKKKEKIIYDKNTEEGVINKYIDENSDTPAKWVDDISDEIDYIIPFTSVARDIQQWILSMSMYPQPALSYIATIATISTLIGRTINADGIKGTFMAIAMAESGEGKDWPLKACEKILDRVGMSERVHKKMASGAALMDALQETPAMLLQIDEIGNYLSSISGKGASSFAKEIIGIITECYTSGSDKFTGKRVKDNTPTPIYEPNLSVIGASTERQIFDGISTSGIADGSLARYMMVFGKNNLMPIRLKKNISFSPPDDLICKITDMVKEHNEKTYLYSHRLNISDDYDDAKWKLTEKMKKKANSLNVNDAMFKPFYNRSTVRIIQMAMAIDQCKSIDVLNWCENIETSSVRVFIKKFKHLGADNDNEKHVKLLEAKIKESGINGISAEDLRKKTRQIQTYSRKSMISEMLESGVIYQEKIKKNYQSQRGVTYYFWKKQ